MTDYTHSKQIDPFWIIIGKETLTWQSVEEFNAKVLQKYVKSPRIPVAKPTPEFTQSVLRHVESFIPRASTENVCFLNASRQSDQEALTNALHDFFVSQGYPEFWISSIETQRRELDLTTMRQKAYSKRLQKPSAVPKNEGFWDITFDDKNVISIQAPYIQIKKGIYQIEPITL
jgi:hypothetical protein